MTWMTWKSNGKAEIRLSNPWNRSHILDGRVLVSLLLLLFTGCAETKAPKMDETEKAVDDVMNQLQSTPEGRAEVERIGNKDVQLERFQRQHDISDRIAEAAIKEWVLTHGGNFDWILEDVKKLCLRNKKDGIPHQYLPESEK